MGYMGTGEEQHLAVGFDFGTTNNSVAIAGPRRARAACIVYVGRNGDAVVPVGAVFRAVARPRGRQAGASLTGPAAYRALSQTPMRRGGWCSR